MKKPVTRHLKSATGFESYYRMGLFNSIQPRVE